MKPLFTLHTPQGLQVFACDRPEDMRREVCARLDANPDGLLIEQDHRRHPAAAFPFTVWSRDGNETRGAMLPVYRFKEAAE